MSVSVQIHHIRTFLETGRHHLMFGANDFGRIVAICMRLHRERYT